MQNDDQEEVTQIGDAMIVVNEFAAVRVRKVRTRNGERLEITSPTLGHTIRLDALALESLTWQTPSTFSRFLEKPFGPGPNDDRL